MYVYRKDAVKLLGDFRDLLVSNIQDKSNFLLKFLKQDDWSFVIKTHALIEAAVTHTIVENIGDVRLRPVFERLPLSDAQVGKLLVLKHLGILSDEQRKFIRYYSELRNRLAHKVENVDFKLKAHLKALDKNQLRAWRETVLWFTKPEERKDWLELSGTNPKLALHMSIFLIVADCMIAGSKQEVSRKLDEVAAKTSAELLKHRSEDI